jgi:hypothetical protein
MSIGYASNKRYYRILSLSCFGFGETALYKSGSLATIGFYKCCSIAISAGIKSCRSAKRERNKNNEVISI